VQSGEPKVICVKPPCFFNVTVVEALVVIEPLDVSDNVDAEQTDLIFSPAEYVKTIVSPASGLPAVPPALLLTLTERMAGAVMLKAELVAARYG
jgi:hypothetical protein